MRAVFSEVRDLVRSGGRWDQKESKWVWDGTDNYNHVLEFQGGRPLNLMAFLICSNLPQDIELRVAKGTDGRAHATKIIPSCTNKVYNRFAVVQFCFPLSPLIPHYPNGNNHRGGTAYQFFETDPCVYIDEAANRSDSRDHKYGAMAWIRPPAWTYNHGYHFIDSADSGVVSSTIPDEYVESADTLNSFVPFVAPHVPGYVFKGFYTVPRTDGYYKEEMPGDSYGTMKYDDGIPVLPPVLTHTVEYRDGRWATDWLDDDLIAGAYKLTGATSPYLSYSYYGPVNLTNPNNPAEVFHYALHGEHTALQAYPTDPSQFSRVVWSGAAGATEEQRRTFYGAHHLVADQEVFGFLWWRFYFSALLRPQWLKRNDASRLGHLFGSDGRTIIPNNISPQAYLHFSEHPLYSPSQKPVAAEGVVVRYNLLMLKYAKMITVTYSVNTAAGSFNESEDVPTYEDTYELPVDTASPSAAITIPHVYCKHDFELMGWFTGYRSLSSDPRKNPAIRQMSTGDRVSGDTYIWAWWARTFEVEAKLGVRGMYFETWPKYSNVLLAEWTWKRPGYYRSSGYSDNFSMTLFEGSWCRFYFAMIGDWSYFFGPGHLAYPTVTSTGFRTWNEMLENGDTGYYVAKDQYGRVLSAASSDYGGVPLQPVELNFTFDATPPTVEYYTYANLPVHLGYGVAAVKYTIDGGAEQTIVPASPAPAPGHEVVVWINDVPAGSTVKVWGTAIDPDTNVNFDGTTKTVIDPPTGASVQVENVQTFVADGTASIVWFRFMLRIGALEVREIAYDSMFLWQEFAENVAVSDVSAGALSKHIRNAGFSAEYWADGTCCDSIVLFARQGHGRVETAHGANHAMVPVTAGETYSMALDVSCAAWDEATEDPSTITEVYGSGDYYNTTLHCSARVVFYDENDAVILDGQGNELTYEIERGYVEGEHYGGWSAYRGKTMDFQAPTGATHAQVILIADEGYKVQFHDVRFCTKRIFDNATTVIKGSSTAYRYRKWNVRRAFFTPETFGPNYGSRMNIPSAEWTNGSYAFGGWVTSDNAVIGVDTEIQDANLVLHSTWKGASVALILNTMGGKFYKIENGAEVVDANAFYQRRNVGDTYGELPTPRRNDLRPFEGWWTAATGGTRATSDTVIVAAGSITLYAHWGVEPSDVKHDLFFDAVGGTVGESSREVAEGAEYGYLPKPTKARCQFLGWFTELNGGTQATEYDRMGYYDVTLYAHWSAEAQGSGSKPTGEVPAGAQVVQWGYVRYTIKLVTNGGEVASSYGALKYNGGIAKALPTAAQVTKSGATFGGWYETADFSGSAVTEIPATATGTKTFYARWV